MCARVKVSHSLTHPPLAPPSPLALINVQLELLLLCCALLWTVGPELGREPNVVKKFVPYRNR